MKRWPLSLLSKFIYLAALELTTLAPAGCNSASGDPAASFPESLTLKPVATGLSKPTDITHAGDGSNRLFIVEQKGTVRILRNGALAATPFLDITREVRSGGERGLLGIAFPPDFAKRKIFFVDYTNKSGVGNTVIARFSLSADPNRADAGSEKKILGIVQPFANHNGGQVAFGPDKQLYIATGDGGSGGDPFGNGQSKKSLLGKLLRIDVLSGATPYAIPQGNPFKNEIWAYGLRNPWRFSFDRENGDLYIADVGQDKIEEIDYQPARAGAGANYGWNVMEGSACFKERSCRSSGLTLPVAEYKHGKGDCSITGGYVYRGSNKTLRGIYVYGDYCSGRIWGLRKSAGRWETRLLKETGLAISTFGQDEQGELYLADHNSGTIYRIESP